MKPTYLRLRLDVCNSVKQYYWQYKADRIFNWGKCPKIAYIKVSDTMSYAISADPVQNATSGPLWSGSELFVNH